MDIQTRKSILLDAFNELKSKWANVEVEEDVDELPESRISDLMELRDKYNLNDIEFLFIVGAAVGFYHGQKVAYENISKKISSVSEFVYSLLGRRL
ncbi:MAG: hypothetical protein ABWW66_02240 [Archaeoglobaceae archaeon]